MQKEHLTPDFSSIRKLIAKNTFFNFVGQVLPIIAAILGVPILIKYLGTERFGILSILWMLMWYSTMLDLGLGRATTKFVANALARGEFENISKIVWTSVLMQVIIGIALAIVSLFLTPFIVEKVLKISPGLISEARTSFYLIFLFTPIILVSTSLQGVLEAYQRFDLINFVLAPVKIGVLILSILGAVLNLKLTGIVVLLIMMRVLMIFTLFALD
ncbi:MatE protein, partial [Candidatus Kryptonium thompsonii]